MSDIQERLQKLLDGELDAAEVAEDAALASLADRLYGIKIQPVQPKKLRDFQDPVNTPSAPLPATDMMIEVIGDVALAHPASTGGRSFQHLPQFLQFQRTKGPRNLEW